MCLWTSKYWRVNTGHLLRLKRPKSALPMSIRIYTCMGIYMYVTFLNFSISYFLHCLPFTYVYVCLSIYTCIYKVFICICLYGTSLYYNFFFLISSLFAFYICMCMTLYIYRAYTYICVYMALFFTILFYLIFSLILTLFVKQYKG